MLVKSIVSLIIALLFFTQACEKIPDPLTPEQALDQADVHLGDMQSSFALFFGSASTETMKLMRMIAMQDGANYNDAFTRESGNVMREEGYRLLRSYDALVKVAKPADLTTHLGQAKVLKAYVLMTMVDLFGEIANPDFAEGESYTRAPAKYESEAYELAFELLDQAIIDLQLKNTSVGYPATDRFFGGNSDNRTRWIAVAYALKMKWAMNMQDFATFDNASLSAITSRDQDFNYSYQFASTDLAHPLYYNHYTEEGEQYISNYFMWVLKGGEEGSAKKSRDPRIRYYVYRQVESASGQNTATLSCLAQPRPAHYDLADPFCLATNQNIQLGTANGYWGRDHGDTNKNFSDSQLRTVYGVYPFGGEFDNNLFSSVIKDRVSGGQGKGIWPIMDASFLDFMRAERILTTGGDASTARTFLRSGIIKSIDKVINLSDEMIVVDEVFKPTDEEINLYVEEVMLNFDISNDKLNILAQEFNLSLWGNGLEAWNLYKRTGRPLGLQLTIEPSPGIPFPHLFLYPSIFTNTDNSHRFGNVSFWDNFGHALK